MNLRALVSMLLLSLALLLTVAPSASAATVSKTMTVYFPSPTDEWVIAYYPYMWHAGDYITGNRDLGRFALLTGMDIHVVLSYNVLWGIGEVDIDVYVNGVKVGSFVVKPGNTAVDASFSFKMLVKGGAVTIKYLETNTVASGYGSITIDSTASTVTFKGLII